MSSQQPLLPRYTLPPVATPTEKALRTSAASAYNAGANLAGPVLDSRVVRRVGKAYTVTEGAYYGNVAPRLAEGFNAVSSYRQNGYTMKARKPRIPPSGPILAVQQAQATPKASALPPRSRSSPAALRPTSAAPNPSANSAGSVLTSTGASPGLAEQGQVRARQARHWQTPRPF